MIYVCEHHDQVLDLWRAQDLCEIRLAHVDFHDDLRGLLVDRQRGVAYPIGKLARGGVNVDPGNFLAHAVLEKRIQRVRWIHGRVGGRAWDAGIVRYETDWLALRHRIRHAWRRGPEVPLELEELLVENWDGIAEGERLSVDWDCFASHLLDAEGINSRVSAFLGRLGSFAPQDTYLVYSPEYSHLSLERFYHFAHEIASRFGQMLEWLSPGLRDGRLEHGDSVAELPSDLLMRAVLFLRRRGIY